MKRIQNELQVMALELEKAKKGMDACPPENFNPRRPAFFMRAQAESYTD